MTSCTKRPAPKSDRATKKGEVIAIQHRLADRTSLTCTFRNEARHARGNRGSGWFTLSRANFPKISHHPTVWRAALLHLKIVNHCGINLVCCL